MKIIPVCSSSKGNSTFIGDNKNGILIDIGCSFRSLKEILKSTDTPLESIRAVLITHEHCDHVGGLLQLTKHTDIPVYASPQTLEHLLTHGLVDSAAELHCVDELECVDYGIGLKAFRTPHDSVESVGYTLTYSSGKIGFCTDLGNVTDEVRANLLGCQTVFLESNYDLALLNSNRNYPMYLKKRIASDIGHLSNSASSTFCCELVKSGTRQIILGHLSQENNTPQIAYNANSDRLSAEGISVRRDYLLDIAPVLNTDASAIAV